MDRQIAAQLAGEQLIGLLAVAVAGSDPPHPQKAERLDVFALALAHLGFDFNNSFHLSFKGIV